MGEAFLLTLIPSTQNNFPVLSTVPFEGADPIPGIKGSSLTKPPGTSSFPSPKSTNIYSHYSPQIPRVQQPELQVSEPHKVQQI